MRNRFAMYLAHTINTMGSTFKAQYNTVSSGVLEYRIFDYKYYQVKGFEKVQPLIFVLIDKKGSQGAKGYTNEKQKEKDFLLFLKYVRSYSGYVDDYTQNLNNLHWVIIKIPERFIPAYDHWLKGEYSKMYSPSDLKEIKIFQIHQGEISKRYLVLTKHPTAIDQLKQVIQARFGTNHFPENPDEYDIRPVWKEEIYNFEETALKLIQ